MWRGERVARAVAGERECKGSGRVTALTRKSKLKSNSLLSESDRGGLVL